MRPRPIRTLYCRKPSSVSAFNTAIDSRAEFTRKEYMKEISFIDTRPLARTSPLAISLVLHAALIFLLTLIPGNTVGFSPAHETRKHTVLVLNFRDLPYRTRKGAGSHEDSKLAASRP